MSAVLPNDAVAGKRRIEVIDALRGLALVAMATYHFSWDLEFFGYLDPVTATSGFLKYYARAIAGSFLFLAGLSLVLGHYPSVRWQSFGRRLAMIVAAALAISAATYIATPDTFIFFGILHSIALASVLGLAFLSLPPIVTLVIGAFVITLPQVWRSDMFDAPWLWWIGLTPAAPRSNDFVPLMPWFGMVLFGIATGRLLLSSGLTTRLRQMPAGPELLRLAGRHSLAVYLLHQPVLIAIVWLLTLVAPPAAADPNAAYLRSCELNCSAHQADARLCVRFCACTLDRLQQQNLLAELQSGTLSVDNNDRISRLASECTAASR